MHSKNFFFIRSNLSSLVVLLFGFWVLFCFLFFESFNFPAYPVFSASCWARKSVLRQLWLVFAVHTLVCVLAGWAGQMPLVRARQFSPVWASLLYAHFLFYPLTLPHSSGGQILVKTWVLDAYEDKKKLMMQFQKPFFFSQEMRLTRYLWIVPDVSLGTCDYSFQSHGLPLQLVHCEEPASMQWSLGQMGHLQISCGDSSKVFVF